MIKIYFHTNYPKDLAAAIGLLHGMQFLKEYDVERVSIVAARDDAHSVFFMFDRALKGVDIPTLSHRTSGYRVFAFKLPPTERFDAFRLGLTLMHLWPKILEKIKNETDPFLYSYNYSGRTLKKEK